MKEEREGGREGEMEREREGGRVREEMWWEIEKKEEKAER